MFCGQGDQDSRRCSPCSSPVCDALAFQRQYLSATWARVEKRGASKSVAGPANGNRRRARSGSGLTLTVQDAIGPGSDPKPCWFLSALALHGAKSEPCEPTVGQFRCFVAASDQLLDATFFVSSGGLKERINSGSLTCKMAMGSVVVWSCPVSE